MEIDECHEDIGIPGKGVKRPFQGSPAIIVLLVRSDPQRANCLLLVHRQALS
jgi:hypothetical protein